MTTRLQELLGLATIVVLVTASLQLTGCSTGYNQWTPRNPEPVAERSCASGYYQCRSGSMDHDKNGLAR
ncbi:hypothetical protein QFZ34_002097 [Phyllobacterium ifriqiyense]|uniref:Lipoprotein n=1 Tax=Phyllobacterium ifriqiyense TaxID=314238 RepID=A0ABU0S849_9HYPH|nr:hypothetical protein [Phyllobacterium ifriqiyense]MDQ0996915.1 hypothetical protein [Phyllobacterium ifriqiyense]